MALQDILAKFQGFATTNSRMPYSKYCRKCGHFWAKESDNEGYCEIISAGYRKLKGRGFTYYEPERKIPHQIQMENHDTNPKNGSKTQWGREGQELRMLREKRK